MAANQETFHKLTEEEEFALWQISRDAYYDARRIAAALLGQIYDPALDPSSHDVFDRMNASQELAFCQRLRLDNAAAKHKYNALYGTNYDIPPGKSVNVSGELRADEEFALLQAWKRANNDLQVAMMKDKDVFAAMQALHNRNIDMKLRIIMILAYAAVCILALAVFFALVLALVLILTH